MPSAQAVKSRAMKGKAKGKAKGRAKSKAGKKTKASTLKRNFADPSQTEGAEEFSVAVKTKQPTLNNPAAMRKKLVQEIGERSCETVLYEQRSVLAQTEARIEDVKAAVQDRDLHVAEVQAKYEQIRVEVARLVAAEQEAAKLFKEAKDKKAAGAQKVDEAKRAALEAQKKYAMLEVLAVNAQKMRELEEKRRIATEAAQAAKRNLADQRLREKAALEATRKALEAAKTMARESKAAARCSVKRTLVFGGSSPRASQDRATEDAVYAGADLDVE